MSKSLKLNEPTIYQIKHPDEYRENSLMLEINNSICASILNPTPS